jgi:hypothetical protein
MSESTPSAEPTPEPTASTPPPSPASPAPATRDAGAAVETLKSAHVYDLGTIGAGLVVLVGSLLPYYTISVSIFGTSAGGSSNAWGGGFFGWFAALLALAGAGVLVARILGVSLPVPVRTTVLGLFGAALLLTLVALFVFPGGGCNDMGITGVCDGVDEGRGVGYWLALLGTVAGTALAFLRRTAD